MADTVAQTGENFNPGSFDGGGLRAHGGFSAVKSLKPERFSCRPPGARRSRRFNSRQPGRAKLFNACADADAEAG
jgi:hypothetical protein